MPSHEEVLESKRIALETKALDIIDAVLLEPLNQTVQVAVKEAVASKRQALAGEDDPGWLAVSHSTTYFYDFTTSELQNIREVSRNLFITNEVYKNVIAHYRNHVVGAGLSVEIYAEDLDNDPTKLATAKDSTVAKMKENWKLFCIKNNMHKRTLDWFNRKKRDGEAFLRLFLAVEGVPVLRFMDPSFIESDKETAPYGIEFDKKDIETVKKYYVTYPEQKPKALAPEEIIHTKDVVDMDVPRGFVQGYSVFTNLRRADKLMVNVSVLAQIQSAIAMIRSHKSANGAKVKSFLDRTAAGTRTTTSGSTVRTKTYQPGTILDAPEGTEYNLPAHAVKAEGLLNILEKELGLIAACFVLPVQWLLSEETAEPLPPSSPTIANFRTEQIAFYSDYIELFWRVQEAMGIDRETNEVKYKVIVNGPRLAIAKALDEARADEIYQRLGANSPQEIAAKNGRNWTVSRANTIKHRETAMEGEQMPGDAGNTDTSSDGTTKKDGGQKGADGDGGNNK